MMKAKLWKRVFIPLAFVFYVLLSGLQDAAAQREEDDSGYSTYIYGWIRNNAGVFTENRDYAQSGNDLAIMRTWLRLNAELRFSNQFDAGVVLQLAHEPTYKMEKGSVSRSGGKEYSEYDDINDVLRELWIRWTPSSEHSFKFGRQIVIWGESFVPVGDVIQYSDGHYDPGFTNIEDSRIPEWMLRANHFIESLNSEFEWIVQFNWLREDFRNGLGAVNASPFSGLGPQRWAIYPEDRAGPSGLPPHGGVKRIKSSNSLDDTRFGFRTTSFNWNTQYGLMYWHGHSATPVSQKGKIFPPAGPGAPPTQELSIVNPKVNYIGCYANRDMDVGLLKWDFMWIPDQPYNTFDTSDRDGMVRRDTLKYMLSWEINSKFWFDWHKTAAFDVTLTHIGTWIPDCKDIQHVVFINRQYSFEPMLSGMFGTSWVYGLYNTNVMVVYNPKAKDGFLSPSVIYNPSWMGTAWKFSLAYTRYFGESKYHVPFGALQQNDYVVLTTQYSF